MLGSSNTGLFKQNDHEDVVLINNVSDSASSISIEYEGLIFTADYSRIGNDLRIEGDAGKTLFIENYFISNTPADLLAPNGAILRGEIVKTLAGPETAGQYVQAAGGEGGVPIGQVETIGGAASVQRTDGTIEQLTAGSKVFQNDVLITEGGSTLSVTFLDGTIFTLSETSRMVLSELVYTPDGSENSALFDLVEGGFVFIAGEVAKTGNMDVKTPVATMGIRGTTVKVDVVTREGVTTVEVSLNTDPDGTIGNFIITSLNGEVIASVDAVDTKWIIAPDGNSATEVDRTQIEFGRDLVLIEQAVNAYQSAQGRVSRGGNFVEPDNTDPNAPNGNNNDEEGGEEPEGQQNQDGNNPGDQGQLNGSGLETDVALNNGNSGGNRNGITIPELNPFGNQNDDNPPLTNTNNDGGGLLPNSLDPETPLQPGEDVQDETAGPLDISVPVSVAAVTEDGSASLGGFGFTAPSGSTLDVSITLGSTIRLNPGSGVVILSGELEPGTTDEYHSLVIQGTAAQINEALNGATYTATPDDDDGGFIRIVAFDGKSTVTVEVLIPITPSNDAPFVNDITVEVEAGDTASGILTAFDVDGDNVTFVPTDIYGDTTEEGGYIIINADGSYSYTPPSSTFVGFDSYIVTVTDDADMPLTATGKIEFEVSKETAVSNTGQEIDVAINGEAVDDDPLGNLSIKLSSFNAPNINLVFAMDGSGSVGSTGWASTVSAVSGALSALKTSLAGSPVQVDVHIFEFAGGNTSNNILTLDTNNANGKTNAGSNLFSFDLNDDLQRSQRSLQAFRLTAVERHGELHSNKLKRFLMAKQRMKQIICIF